jgi:Transposase IS4
MSIITKNTNSYAFRTNTAQNPWKSLINSELYHFFGCLIRLALYKQPPRVYIFSLGGVLFQTLLSKNRFEQILRNFYFLDRGLNPVKGHWWEKLEPIFSILKEKCLLY